MCSNSIWNSSNPAISQHHTVIYSRQSGCKATPKRYTTPTTTSHSNRENISHFHNHSWKTISLLGTTNTIICRKYIRCVTNTIKYLTVCLLRQSVTVCKVDDDRVVLSTQGSTNTVSQKSIWSTVLLVDPPKTENFTCVFHYFVSLSLTYWVVLLSECVVFINNPESLQCHVKIYDAVCVYNMVEICTSI